MKVPNDVAASRRRQHRSRNPAAQDQLPAARRRTLANRIVPPPFGDAADRPSPARPARLQRERRQREEVAVVLPASGWLPLGSSGYRYRGASTDPVQSVTVKADQISIRGARTPGATLNEPSQGRIAVPALVRRHARLVCRGHREDLGTSAVDARERQAGTSSSGASKTPPPTRVRCAARLAGGAFRSPRRAAPITASRLPAAASRRRTRSGEPTRVRSPCEDSAPMVRRGTETALRFSLLRPRGGATMAKITVGELLVRCFAARASTSCAASSTARTSRSWCTPAIRDALRQRAPRGSGVHLAEGYARIAHNPAVVIGNPACGTGNLIAGLVSALRRGTSGDRARHDAEPPARRPEPRRRLAADRQRGDGASAHQVLRDDPPVGARAGDGPMRRSAPRSPGVRARCSSRSRTSCSRRRSTTTSCRRSCRRHDTASPTWVPATRRDRGVPPIRRWRARSGLRARRQGRALVARCRELLALADHLQAGMSATLGTRRRPRGPLALLPPVRPRRGGRGAPRGRRGARRRRASRGVRRLGRAADVGRPGDADDDPDRRRSAVDRTQPSVDVALVADARRAPRSTAGARARKSAARAEMAGLARYREQSAGTMAQGSST